MSLQEEIKKELKVNKSKLDDEATLSPLLIQKYLDKYYIALRDLNKLQMEYDKTYSEKLLYYRNNYDKVPENVNELKALIECDKEYIDVKGRLNTHNILTQYLKEIVQQFRDRNWAIKNTLEFLKYTQGGAL